MIKNVIIHAGVPKTGSTSIQEMFFEQRVFLRSSGYLYPEVKITKTVFQDHSFILQFLFKNEPENLVWTKLLKLNSERDISKAQEEIRQQFKDQIEKFSGENLILSGEHLGNLDIIEIESLKSYFADLSHKNVNFFILFVCRHPVSRSVSGIQQLVKSGLSFESAFKKIEREIKDYYQSKISNYLDVFGPSSVKVIQFEKAITHPLGTGGYVWDMFGIEKNHVGLRKNKISNSSTSYEGITLIEAINREVPRIGYGLKDKEFKYKAINLLIELPGSKFDVSQELKINWWNNAQPDMDWIKQYFSIPAYEYIPDTIIDQNKRWTISTLWQLYKIFLFQSYLIRNVVLETIENELKCLALKNSLNKISTQYRHLKLLKLFSIVLVPLDKTRVLVLLSIKKIAYRIKMLGF